MTLIAILLTSFALLFFIFTRTTYVYIKYNGEMCLEFHFVIFSLKLIFNDKEKSSFRLRLGFYSSLIKRLSRFSKVSEIRLIHFSLENGKSHQYEKLFPAPYGIAALISAVFAYFADISRKITIEENAIILTPDLENTHIELRLYTELFNLLILFTKLIFDLKKYSKKRKFSYVGN